MIKKAAIIILLLTITLSHSIFSQQLPELDKRYIKNTYDIDDGEDTGWATGVKFGHKKAKKPGQWQGKYQYVHLERDAFPDAYPDSDRYSGKTDVKGHEVAFKYAWMKNVTLGLDYYYNDRIKATENKEHLVQFDTVVKF